LNALTRSIAVDYGRQGIRCNALSVGYVVNERRDAGMSAERRAELEAMHLTRLGQPTTSRGRSSTSQPRERVRHRALLPVDGGGRSHAGASSADVAVDPRAPRTLLAHDWALPGGHGSRRRAGGGDGARCRRRLANLGRRGGDTGRELDLARLIAEGHRLYVDVAYYYGPIAPQLNALLMRVFGAHLNVLVAAGS
jgi:hypothetical protein